VRAAVELSAGCGVRACWAEVGREHRREVHGRVDAVEAQLRIHVGDGAGEIIFRDVRVFDGHCGHLSEATDVTVAGNVIRSIAKDSLAKVGVRTPCLMLHSPLVRARS
jgi:hypothetical protein